jgi:hypothetical protein
MTAMATKTKPIGNYDDCRFTAIVNITSTAAPIGRLPKGAEFCHTSNRLLVGCQRGRALLRLYFNSSVVSQSFGWLVGCWSVHNENCYAMTFGGDQLYIECTRYSCNILLIYIKVL